MVWPACVVCVPVCACVWQGHFQMSSAHKVNVKQCRNKKSKASLAPTRKGKKGRNINIDLVLPDVCGKKVGDSWVATLVAAGHLADPFSYIKVIVGKGSKAFFLGWGGGDYNKTHHTRSCLRCKLFSILVFDGRFTRNKIITWKIASNSAGLQYKKLKVSYFRSTASMQETSWKSLKCSPPLCGCDQRAAIPPPACRHELQLREDDDSELLRLTVALIGDAQLLAARLSLRLLLSWQRQAQQSALGRFRLQLNSLGVWFQTLSSADINIQHSMF